MENNKFGVTLLSISLHNPQGEQYPKVNLHTYDKKQKSTSKLIGSTSPQKLEEEDEAKPNILTFTWTDDNKFEFKVHSRSVLSIEVLKNNGDSPQVYDVEISNFQNEKTYSLQNGLLKFSTQTNWSYLTDEESSDEEELPELTFEILTHRSQIFSQPFPTSDNRILHCVPSPTHPHAPLILDYARNTRILVHHSVPNLTEKFLILKKSCGTPIEKQVYENMTVQQFIKRLIKKRPVVFYTSYDITTTRSGRNLEGKDWKLVGTEKERLLTLKRYMSYDEMPISALLGVSSPTLFINNGNRYNAGSKGRKGTYHPEGVYVGLVGARFEKTSKMESQHILILERKDHKGAGIRPSENLDSPAVRKSRLWAEFYGEKYEDQYCFPTYAELFSLIQEGKVDARNYLHTRSFYSGNRFFNIQVFKKRIKLSVEIFLVDANERGREARKRVYVHTVGLGLGVWQICAEQGKWSVEAYAEIIQERSLPWISDLDFSWFPTEIDQCNGVAHGEKMKVNGNSIRIHFSKRDPADPLDDPGKLLVACYAWDSNSFPGNEYWRGGLTASGDPAAACCSLIPELQNAYINKWLLNNLWECPEEDPPQGSPPQSESEQSSNNGDSDVDMVDTQTLETHLLRLQQQQILINANNSEPTTQQAPSSSNTQPHQPSQEYNHDESTQEYSPKVDYQSLALHNNNNKNRNSPPLQSQEEEPSQPSQPQQEGVEHSQSSSSSQPHPTTGGVSTQEEHSASQEPTQEYNPSQEETNPESSKKKTKSEDD